MSVETVIYPLAFFLSSLLLGGVTVGMLIGHWYLIDTGQSLDPFIRIYKFFVYALAAQCLFYLVASLLLFFAGNAASVTGVEERVNVGAQAGRAIERRARARGGRRRRRFGRRGHGLAGRRRRGHGRWGHRAATGRQAHDHHPAHDPAKS